MGGNYAKDIYKQLMEVMERCDSLKKDLSSVKASSNAQLYSLNNEITYLDSKCNKLEAKNVTLRQEVDDLTYLSEVIYGDTIKILAVDLYSEGNISLERIQKLISSLSGQAITLSQGSIFHFLK